MPRTLIQRTRRRREGKRSSRAALAGVLAVALGAAPGFADQWLVYVGGGVESIADKGWTERRGQVLFTQRGGTLVSVPFDDVDLATSAFVTWQMSGRRRLPPRAPVPTAPPETRAGSEAPCTAARVLALRGGETLDVAVGETAETVHLACLDTPETRHRSPQLAWFGRAALSWMEVEIKPGARVCLTEHEPPLRDGDGHRILYVSSASGRDYVAAVIENGLGLLRLGPCGRAAEYSALEGRAIAEERGLWGPRAESPALAALSHSGGAASGPPPPRPRSGGARGGG